MKKVIDWTLGSFFRTLGKIILYIVLALIAIYITQSKGIKIPSIFSALEVYAVENINFYEGYNISDSGMFWNVGSSGASQRGYKVYTTDSNNYAYYADPTSNITLSNGGGGMGITQCGYGFLANNYYSITYIFNSGFSPYLHPYYTNKNPQVVGFSNTNTNYYSNVNYTSVNNNVQQVHTGDGDYISLFTIIAKANSTGTCITVTFSANSSLSYNDYFYFRGAKIESLGSQAPSTTEISNALTSQFNQLNTTINNLSTAINQQSQQQHQDHLETKNLIDGDSNNVESNACGILCKLKNLLGIFKLDNLKYLIIPTEAQMQELLNDMQDKINSKLGLLGLPITIYTRLMNLAMTETEQNWCLEWEGIEVPNFEEYNIIESGTFCFSDILQNEKINTFRNTCIVIVGSLILLSFVSYLYNAFRRVLDVPDRDEYVYLTTNENENYLIDDNTGEAIQHWHNTRRSVTRRQKV